MQTWREGGDERRRRRWKKEEDASRSSHSTLLWVRSLKPVQLVSIDTMLRKRLRATKHRGATTVHSSCVALVRLLRPGQQLMIKRALFGRRASEVPLHRCSALHVAWGRDCTLGTTWCSGVQSIIAPTLHLLCVGDKIYTHCRIEPNRSDTWRQRSPKGKRNTTTSTRPIIP